jgi:serine/threonine protein kinase
MAAFQPEAFGRYYLVDKIAVGGMAEVFKAKSFARGGFEKLLVIKRILGHLSDNEEFVAMFVDEAKISVELQHPNIVQIYDFGQIHENHYIAMECVDGKDLKGILRKLARRRQILPLEYAVYITHEMCKGLGHAHEKRDIHGQPLGIVHRDISPSNVLVSYRGEVKIADFGIAKAESSAYNTRDGVLKGKFEYMSPEQARGETITAQADVFCTGILLHEMLTGRRLFKGESDIQTLEAIKAVDVLPPSQINPNVPRRLDAIVMKALAKDTAERWPTAKHMQTALLEFMYPATPDVTRESLAHFMPELFEEEQTEEVERLKAGTAKATQLWSHAPEPTDWEGNTGSSSTIGGEPASSVGLMMAVGAVLVLSVLVIFVTLSQPEPQVIEVPTMVEAPVATTGRVQISVGPASASVRTFLAGELVGEGAKVDLMQVAAGQDLALRVEAEGHEPHEETIRVDPGERLRLSVDLTPIRRRRPTQVAAPAAPLVQREVVVVEVEVEKPAEPPPPAGPGKVTVNVKSGWATVWIDGRKIDTTPLFNHSISAGTHTIRVVNPGIGVDESQTVTISSGEVSRVVF